MCQQQIGQQTTQDLQFGAITYGCQEEIVKYCDFNQNCDQITEFFVAEQQYSEDQKEKPEKINKVLSTASQLKWLKQTRLVIIISKSPCYDFGEEIIRNLILKNIVLLGIRVSDETTIMYNQIALIYQRLKHPEMFFTLKLVNISEQEITTNITKMVLHLIGVNNSVCLTKQNQMDIKSLFKPALQDMYEIKKDVYRLYEESYHSNQDSEILQIDVDKAQQDLEQYKKYIENAFNRRDSSFEALSKVRSFGQLSRFREKFQYEPFQCKAFRIGFKDEIFNQKRQTIDSIEYNDINFQLIDAWQGYQTSQPIAEGMMKKVYLMEKDLQLYALKIPHEPYKNIKDAIHDCRSHLIAKTLMNEFTNKINQRRIKQIKIQYTDLIILQEVKQGVSINRYWLAELYPEGDFMKYNNNNGFILNESLTLNKYLQAFTYYTYHTSGQTYIVNNVQGIGEYLTDPSINTILGNFDLTDNGNEGIENYLSTFNARKNLWKEELKLVDIFIN